MITNQEKLDECKVKVSFSFEKEKVSSVVDEIANDVRVNYKIAGFRKGKASIDAIKVAARKYILDTARQKLVTEAYEDIMFENNWKSFGQPFVNDVKIGLNNFYVQMTIGYMPEFELNSYKELEVPAPENLPTIDLVADRTKESLCMENGDQLPFEENDFILNGDTVIINYTSLIDGQPYENSSAEGVLLNVGTNQALDGFEENLIGMRPGETREFELTFGEDFSVPVMAGKTVKFMVELMSASRKSPATYSDELAQKLGLKDLADLEEKVLASAQQQLDNYAFQMVRQSVLLKLLESNSLEVPMWMVVEVAKQLCQQQKLDWSTIDDESRGQLLLGAKNKIKLTFFFEKIKEQEPDTVLSTEELLSIVNANANNFPENVRTELQKGTNFALFQQIFTEVQDEHISKWLVKSSKFVKEEVKEQTLEVKSE
jgi:trigger factor